MYRIMRESFCSGVLSLVLTNILHFLVNVTFLVFFSSPSQFCTVGYYNLSTVYSKESLFHVFDFSHCCLWFPSASMIVLAD